MRIGIDARNLVPKQTGIGRYVLEMATHLKSLGNSLILYLPEEPHQELPKFLSDELRISNAPGAAHRLIWGLTTLPKLANGDHLDVFWGPAHRLPPGLAPHLPRIVTIHDLVWRKAAHSMRWQTWLGERLLMGSAVSEADVVIADSFATANDIADAYPAAKTKTHVIYPGRSTFPPSNVTKINPRWRSLNQRYALFVGTLEPRKNLPQLLRAFASLPPHIRRDLHLVIAGGQGWRTRNLTSLIEQCGLSQSVTLAGYVSESELAQLYSAAEVLMMPSLYEGFGFPIVEAQGFGVPAITSNRSSMPEVAARGAILVDPENVTEISEAIIRIYSDANLRLRLSREAIDNAARFSWSKTCNEFMQLAKTAIEKKRAS